jgi:hypothetical protein
MKQIQNMAEAYGASKRNIASSLETTKEILEKSRILGSAY